MNERAKQTQRYGARLERVHKWLADHLDDKIDLARLAEIACMSRYHFHRIYRAMQGETVAETVRRLRLHRAAGELIAGEIPLPRVARRAGYASQEAFSRAFKAGYGAPPSRYRASFVPLRSTGTMEEAMETTSQYQATIRAIPAIRVAALEHRGDYMKIGDTFEQLVAKAAGLNLLNQTTRSFAIYYDDPFSTPHDGLRADACITVPDDWAPSGGLAAREIRGGRYAVTLHVGPYAELELPYRWLYGSWLPQSGEEAADAPCVEEYLNDPRTVPATELKTEIWLPLN